MRIEAVVTCVNYSDFLAHSLPHNRVQFDNMVVVTDHVDTATHRMCEYWNVKCVKTEKFQNHMSKFDKARGINEGLAELKKDGWLMHLDADIVLPPLFKSIIQGLDLDTKYLYGMDRMMCAGYQDWLKFLSRPTLQQENQTWMHLSSFPLGVRVMHAHQYIPIGYAQLWHADSGVLTYPEGHTTAARTDLQFAEQWPRNKRGFIPEIVVYHLESEPAPMGANWNGRKTKGFKPNEGDDAS